MSSKAAAIRARRFRRSEFLRLAWLQVAVHTIEDDDDVIGDARHGRSPA